MIWSGLESLAGCSGVGSIGRLIVPVKRRAYTQELMKNMLGLMWLDRLESSVSM